MIKFKILELAEGAVNLLAIAKSKAEAQISEFAGELGFHRTWPMGDFMVRMQANRYTNTEDWVVRLWLTGGAPDIKNRLLRALGKQPLFNLSFFTPTPETPWYDRVTPIALPAQGDAMKYKIEPLDENFPTLSYTPKDILTQLRDHALARRMSATRFWFRYMPGKINFSYRGRMIIYNNRDCIVSDPSGSDFYVLLGRWDTPRGDDHKPIPVPVPALDPREQRYNGIIISWSALETQLNNFETSSVPGSVPTLMLDDAVPVSIVGRLYTTEQFIQSSSNQPVTGDVLTGQDIRRLESGDFNAYSDLSNPRITFVYRPDENISSFNIVQSSEEFGCSHGMAVVVRKGVMTPGIFGSFSAQTWTQDHFLYRLDGGSFVKTTVPMPEKSVTFGSSHSQVGLPGGFPDIRDFNHTGFDTDMVFFDGTRFKRVGSVVENAAFYHSEFNPSTGTVETFGGGEGLITSSMPVDTSGGVARVSMDCWFPDQSFSLVFGNTIGASQYIIPESQFGAATYTASYTAFALNISQGNGLCLEPNRLHGVAWGQSDVASGSTSEFGYAGIVSIPSFYNSAAPTTTSRIVINTIYQPTDVMQGAFWYRRDTAPGVFIFRPIDGSFQSLCDQFQSSYLSGDKPDWTVLEPLLKQIMTKIAIRANNFATPAMVPWFGIGSRQVIVER